MKYIIDEETCVEYFVSFGTYNMGNITPKYNQDGTLKLNKKCLRDKMEEKWQHVRCLKS